MNLMNSSDKSLVMRTVETMNMSCGSTWVPLNRNLPDTNAFSDGPGVWRAADSQPSTAVWGCRAILAMEAETARRAGWTNTRAR